MLCRMFGPLNQSGISITVPLAEARDFSESDCRSLHVILIF